ncbi:MAG TPA: hypothetical protein VI997_11885 [Candidatus Thermoplasmatota archaeon]|nr:hypothetical protein [Candidatus Thermoplasmatota archaeon]
MARRERLTILLETLDRLDRNLQAGESRSQLAARCNLPYDRFARLMEELQRRGLVDVDLRPTAAADELVERWRELRRMLRDVGASDMLGREPSP